MVDAVNEQPDSAMLNAVAPLLPALRKTAGRYGYAFQYCPRRRMLVALQRGRLTVRPCDSASSARAIDQELRRDSWLSAAQVEELVGGNFLDLLRLERRGRFPRRKKISGRRYGWPAADVEAWIARREAITMSGSRGMSAAQIPAAAIAEACEPCAGCGELFKRIRIDEFGGESRLVNGWRLYFASIGKSPCTGLCKQPRDPLHSYGR